MIDAVEVAGEGIRLDVGVVVLQAITSTTASIPMVDRASLNMSFLFT